MIYMRKIIIFIAVILIIVKSAYTQYNGNLRLGLTAAPTIGWLKSKSDTVLANGTHTGFSFGLISEFVLADNYAFATGFDVASIGAKSKYQRPSEVRYNDYNLKYVEIPLTLKMKTDQISYTSFYGKIGLGLGFNINAKSNERVTDVAGKEISNKKNLDIKKEISFVRASFQIGGGAEIAVIGNTAFLIGFTFNNGLLNMFSNDNTNDKNAINNYVAINVGILF